MTIHRLMSLVAMAFLWTGSQIPVYLFGGIPPYIYGELGGTDRWVWFVLANLLALAAVCPFVGALSDLIGRRYVAISGASFIILGMIVCSTAHSMNIFIGTSSFITSYSSPLTVSSWHGIGRSRRWYQRVDCSRRDI
jgi:MFS family permease